MRRIAIINQKGGVGKTTTSVNLGAALAEQGRRVVLVDLDPQANLSLHLGIEPGSEEPSTYTVLHGRSTFGEALQATSEPKLRVLPSNIDLSGAELELAGAIGRDRLLSDAIDDWVRTEGAETEGADGMPADYLIFDCPPSLGLLSINALAAAGEVVITVQTEFLALMGMSKLVEVVTLIQKRLNPGLKITGIAGCLYDSRLKLAREVWAEMRKYFPGQVFRQPVRSNVKLAEAPSFGASIIEYAPESNGARDYRRLAIEVIEQESAHPDLAHLPAPRPLADLPRQRVEPGSTADPVSPQVEQLPSASPQIETRAPEADAAVPKAEPTPEREVTLTPQPPPETPSAPSHPAGEPAAAEPTASEPPAPTPRAPAPRRRLPKRPPVDAVEEELRIMRSQDLPPLPPEAFEIGG